MGNHRTRSFGARVDGGALGLLLLLPQLLQAEPLRLTLEQCLQRALQDSPELVASRWDVRLAESRVAEARAGQFLPEAKVVSLSGIVPEAKGQVSEPPITTVNDTSNLGPFTRVELQFVQPLFTWGKITAGKRAAEMGLEAETAEQRKTGDEVVYQVKELYYRVLHTRQIADLLGEVKSNFERAIEVAEERLETDPGKVTQSDVLKLKIGLAGVSKEVARVVNGTELARAGLARAIGLGDAEGFDVAAERLEPEAATIKSLEEYTAQVFERSPDWQRLIAGLAAKEAQLTIAEADYYPSVFIAGGYNYAYAPHRDRQLSPFAEDDFNGHDLPGAALGIHWPLTFLRTHARVQGARAEVEKLRAQKQAAATGLVLATKKAYLDAVQTRESMDIADGGRRSSRGLLVTSVSSFELGIGEPDEVFQALIVYTQSSSSYYEAVSDHNLALARLTQAVGEEVATLKY